jgi:hypothetical protein
MKNIVLISGSPKAQKKTASGFLTESVGSHITGDDSVKTVIDVRQSLLRSKKNPDSLLEDFRAMSLADAMIIVFPLYVYCLPGLLMRFLTDYHAFWKSAKAKGEQCNCPKIYPIVNCGFPEPAINSDAVRVVKSFAGHIEADFRFGVMIGGCGMLLGAKDTSIIKKLMSELGNAFDAIADDIQSDGPPKTVTIEAAPKFPKCRYYFMGDMGWSKMAKQNGLKKKDLYRRPYLP